jgi:ElaB/YqjD/DUF883 family membrane-anchored ribosome-binding protein
MKPNPSEVTKERLYQEFNTVVAETEQLLKSVGTAGGDKAGAFKANVEQALAAAGDRLEQIRQQALGQANAAARVTDEYVRDNPWRAVGIVAALSACLGLVAGLLIARR